MAIWRDNIDMILKAFIGGAKARASWAKERAEAADFKARLATIDRRWPGCGGRSADAPVFILSAGWRSGSTLVQRLMMTADNVMTWGEPWHQGNLIDSLMDQLRAATVDWPPEEWIIGDNVTALENQWVANLFPPMRALIDAHYAYFDTLFAKPAHALGKPRWGLKEVRFGSDHAAYLRWLYPKAKIILLYRNPYDAYASYRQVIDHAYLTWPDAPILTPGAYAALWGAAGAGLSRPCRTLGGVPPEIRGHQDPGHPGGAASLPGSAVGPGREDEGHPRQPGRRKIKLYFQDRKNNAAPGAGRLCRDLRLR